MKKALLILFALLPPYFVSSLYFLDKHSFICPIEYKREFVIRCDLRGDGFFAASRNGKRIHQGLDLVAQVGTPVLAVRSGKASVFNQANGMGNYVIIRHAENISTLYGHLSKVYVKNNSILRQGQVLGAAGKTGNANYSDIQAHLHFEVRVNGVAQDPLEYLE
jgi:murein DD-endopeptidase MepM/ murein hydrolase activator NlpD